MRVVEGKLQLIIQKMEQALLHSMLVRRAFKTTFAPEEIPEEYQAGNCQDIVVFGKEAATGLRKDSEDSG